MAQLLFDECNSHQRQTPTKRQKKFVGCSLLKILSFPQLHDAVIADGVLTHIKQMYVTTMRVLETLFTRGQIATLLFE